MLIDKLFDGLHLLFVNLTPLLIFLNTYLLARLAKCLAMFLVQQGRGRRLFILAPFERILRHRLLPLDRPHEVGFSVLRPLSLLTRFFTS